MLSYKGFNMSLEQFSREGPREYVYLEGRVDTLVVLGKNIGEDWTGEDIRNQRFHLSPHSRRNVIAAGIRYKDGLTSSILFSTGQTAGPDVPSEAEAMRVQLKRIFKSIPDAAIQTEEQSWDTNTNAKFVKPKIENGGYRRVGLETNIFHLRRARFLFRRRRVQITQTIASEDIIARRWPRYIQNVLASDLVRRETKKEGRLYLIQRIPFAADVMSWITKRTRGIGQTA